MAWNRGLGPFFRWLCCYGACGPEEDVSPENLFGQFMRHHVRSRFLSWGFHGYGCYATIKECFVCCRCGKTFDRLGEADAHCYLEYLELFGKDDLPKPARPWRCYGCLKEYGRWQNYYRHFRKVYLPVEPGEDPRYLNLVNAFNVRNP